MKLKRREVLSPKGLKPKKDHEIRAPKLMKEKKEKKRTEIQIKKWKKNQRKRAESGSPETAKGSRSPRHIAQLRQD